MQSLLEQLRDCKLVRVTGSFADGTQHNESDIDFYVRPDRNHNIPIGEGKRNIEKVIKIVEAHGVHWTSTLPGYIFTHKSNNPSLTRELEFSDCFQKRQNKLPSVTIDGVEFKTY